MSTPETADVTVVVPVYRNAETITALVDRIRRVLNAERLSHEILFVDDASPDDSQTILRQLARQDPDVHVLALERNLGQHRAVLAGLRLARGRTVAVMDADLQDPPEAIPVLLQKMSEGFAAVFAGRRGRYESRLRLLTSKFLKTALHLVAGVPPDAGMFLVMNREMVDALLSRENRHPYVVTMIGASGLPLASVPVARSSRSSGRSSYSSLTRLAIGLRAIVGAAGCRGSAARSRRAALRSRA